MSKLKKLSDIQVSELVDLCSHILNEIDSYTHVAEFIPSSIEANTRAFYDKLTAEINRRENDAIS